MVLYLFMFATIYMPTTCVQVPKRPEEGVRFLELELQAAVATTGAGKFMWLLCKSGKHSKQVSNLSNLNLE